MKKRYRCLRCGRDKFEKPGPHKCNGQYRKYHLIFEEVTPENEVTKVLMNDPEYLKKRLMEEAVKKWKGKLKPKWLRKLEVDLGA